MLIYAWACLSISHAELLACCFLASDSCIHFPVLFLPSQLLLKLVPLGQGRLLQKAGG